ncbi:N-acylphosphatidylethanolamine synthase [Acorus calamus]|uniref:Tafazzin family protein n=1 Tax=Acorus calamus TaxID=4465 RepID=A0AAV9CXI8_ACOCL|nr:N-acylphosphatidylethanolamine synthase [Acorus calamus]
MEDWIDRGELWRGKARALRIRIRDRFRVAVDRRRQWPAFSESYNSSTLQRLVLRVRAILGRDSSSSPARSKFYRKRVDKDIDDDSVIIRMLQALAVPIIGNVCHVFMHGLNQVQVYGADKLKEALLNRPEGKPLLTVSNHVASVDDPFVIASLLPPNVMLDSHNLRWTLCATDRCFKNPVTSAFFRSVKVLPVSRGDGLYQKGMDLALLKLNHGGWVHIFPEGSRSRDGGRTMGSAKRGVGRLVIDADNVPLVIPFVHTGMQEVMPIGAHFPRIGKRVTVLIGDPIHFDDLIPGSEDAENDSRGLLYDAVSARIGHRLHELKTQVEKLDLSRSLELQNHSTENIERANKIVHQVDWESFGMESYLPMEEDNGHSTTIKQFTETERPPPVSESTHCVKLGFSFEGGIVSRIRGYINPSEFMGFAARGLFANGRSWDESHVGGGREVRLLKAWKVFFEENVIQRLSYN